MDMAGIITAVATVALVLGGLIAWIASNASRLAVLEQSKIDRDESIREVKKAIVAIHDRLDAYFIGRGPRAKKDE
jgi:hypothetical protein